MSVNHEGDEYGLLDDRHFSIPVDKLSEEIIRLHEQRDPDPTSPTGRYHEMKLSQMVKLLKDRSDSAYQLHQIEAMGRKYRQPHNPK